MAKINMGNGHPRKEQHGILRLNSSILIGPPGLSKKEGTERAEVMCRLGLTAKFTV